MQIFSKLFALTLFCGLILQSGAEPVAAQTTSQIQKQRRNERLPTHRVPGIPFDGSVPFLAESRAEILKQRGTAAQDSNTTLIGRWIGGPCNAVVVAGTRAYFGNGPLLMIADISDPGNPTELGKILLPGLVGSVTVSGNFAYVSAGGLRIIDISNPASPTEVGFFPSGGDVAVSGNYAYVAAGDGLHIIDVSNPASPTEVSFLGIFANAVAVSGNYAYVTAYDGGLQIIEVSNPASPTKVGFYANCCVEELDVSGNFAYIAGLDAGLRIIDVSNPASPIEAGFLDTQGFAYDVIVSGNYAYVADAQNGLRIIDVSNPANPTEVGFFDTARLAYSVAVSENLAYVADGGDGLRIIDVSNPASPTEVGFFDTDGFAFRVAVNGNLAYLTDEEKGLYIIRNDFVPTAVESPSDRAPERFHLRQSYPNPLRASLSNSGTTITFTLSKAANVTLEVYNMLGEKITTLVKGAKPAGEHVVNFNASSLPSGIYFYTLTAGDLKQTRKMVITR